MSALIRPWPMLAVIIVVALITGGIGATYLTGTLFASNDTIEACASAKHTRIVDDSNTDCKENETGISWPAEASLTSARTTGSSISVASGAIKSDTVICPSGTILLSGGWGLIGFSPTTAHPTVLGDASTTTSHFVQIRNDGPTGFVFQVIILCATHTP